MPTADKQAAAPTADRPALVITQKNWSPLRLVFSAFIDAHPELGLRASENTFRNFSRIHGPALQAAGVLRKAGLRQPYIADVNTFDDAAYELISRYGYTQALATEGAA